MRALSPGAARALHSSRSQDSALLRSRRSGAKNQRRVTFAIDVESSPSSTGIPQAALDLLSVTSPPFEDRSTHRYVFQAGLSQSALDSLALCVSRVNLSLGSKSPSAGLAQGALDTLRVEEGLPQERLDALCVCSTGASERAITHHMRASEPVQMRVVSKERWLQLDLSSAFMVHPASAFPTGVQRVGRGGA